MNHLYYCVIKCILVTDVVRQGGEQVT